MEQVAVGVGVTMSCIVVSGLGFWMAEILFTHGRQWLREPPHSFKLLVVVIGAGGLVLAVVLTGVTIWAAAFVWLRVFGNFRDAFYFALVSYTTVGYGELLSPTNWRVLGAMAAADGFINIGLLTTLLIEGLRHVRAGYRRTVYGDDAD